MSHRLSFFLLSFLFCLTTVAQTVVVETRIDSTTIRVGEQVRLHVMVSCDKGARVVWPNFKGGHITDSLEVVEVSQVDTANLNEGRRWQLSRSYLLTAFDSAMYRIPPVVVNVAGKAHHSRERLALKVNSIKVDEQHPDQLKSPHAPVEAEFRWTWRIFVLSLLTWFLLGLLLPMGRVLARRKPLMRRIIITPPPPAHKVAIAAIEQLRNEAGAMGEAQKAYYMHLTDVLRSYIHERFGFNAREMTTEEILTALRRADDVQALHELQEVLTTADLVKFARHQTSLVESDRALLQAATYIQRTQIDQPDAEKPREEMVLVADTTQQRIRRTLKVLIGIDLVATLALAAYVCYLLWANFA